MKLSRQVNLIKFIITVLLFNTVMPALASITSPDDKILICTQSGFEWVSVDQKQQQYLALAQQLQLDINELFPEEEESSEPSPPHGKCALCFFHQTDLAALPSSELVVPTTLTKSVVFSFIPKHLDTLGEYESAQPRAPPAVI